MTTGTQAPEAKGFRRKLIAPLAVWLLIYLWPVPAGLNANQWHYFAIFAAVITGLILESMPVGAVGLIGLTVAGVGGYIDPDPTKSLRWMLAGFAESTVWLIVGAFVFSIGYRKSQLGRRIALVLVQKLGTNTLGLGYAVAMSDFLLAPATPSNTARSGGIVYPIISNIPRIYGSEPGPTADKIGTYVMWTAFASTAVTSSLFFTALAPNAAALAIAKKTAGIDVSWAQWFIGFAPLGLLLMVLVPLLSYAVCRPEVKSSPEISEWASKELAEMGPMSRNEWIMLALILLAMFLWIAGSSPDIRVPLLGSNFVNATTVVFIVISADAGDGRDRVCRHRRREGRLGGVLLFHLAADAGLGPQRDRLHQMVRDRIRKAARRAVAVDRNAPAGRAVLLDPLFLLEHHLACRRRAARGARGRIRHPRPTSHDARHALHVFARPDGGDLALRDRAGADVFRERLYRQGSVLGFWADLWDALFRGAPADRMALVAGPLSRAGGQYGGR
ncbi:hypothetical protein ACVWXM_008510 [Bradyrhizobium sp. GM7.3]